MLLVDYYRAAPDLVQFSQYWCPDTTMMDKIKVGRLTENLISLSGHDPDVLTLSGLHALSSRWPNCPSLRLPPQGSLSCHAPKDQAYSQILEHVYSQLNSMH